MVPGLVNAHAHLELSALGGKLPRGAPFGAWVRALVGARGELNPAELEQSARLGARLSLAGGATTVGDLDATGAGESALSGMPAGSAPRVVQFRELLDARQGPRTVQEIARIDKERRLSDFCFAGLGPHGPHTASEALLQAVAGAARRGSMALTTHWAETEEEGQWLETGTGFFAQLLGESPLRSGLDLLDAAGVLGPNLALVHGNHARPEELLRLGRACASLVHCPGSHAFFGRRPFDLRSWRAAGVNVALGTDSLASNSSLDMRQELNSFAASQPWLDPREAWATATRNGARALGLAGRVGELVPGAFADFLAVPAAEADGERCLARLARGEFDIAGLWLSGRAVEPALRSAT